MACLVLAMTLLGKGHLNFNILFVEIAMVAYGGGSLGCPWCSM